MVKQINEADYRTIDMLIKSINIKQNTINEIISIIKVLIEKDVLLEYKFDRVKQYVEEPDDDLINEQDYDVNVSKAMAGGKIITIQLNDRITKMKHEILKILDIPLNNYYDHQHGHKIHSFLNGEMQIDQFLESIQIKVQ